MKPTTSACVYVIIHNYHLRLCETFTWGTYNNESYQFFEMLTTCLITCSYKITDNKRCHLVSFGHSYLMLPFSELFIWGTLNVNYQLVESYE